MLHRGAGTMDEYRPCWMRGIHTPEHRSPSKSWFRHTAAVQSRLPMNVNGMDCVCCGNWLSSIFCHQNACKLAHSGVRCKLMIQYRLMAQWDPAHLSDWFRWSFSKGDARSPELSDSPPFNAREPFRKREPPKLSWPRLTVDDVLLIQCWGGAFSQCFKF